MIKRITTVILCLLILCPLVACKKAQVNRTILKVPFSKLSIPNDVESGTVAENGNYQLLWNAEKACVQLVSKSNGQIWSTIPNEYYKSGDQDGKASAMLSPLELSYVDSDNMSAIKNISGYSGVLKHGKIGTAKIKDGIKVYYSFKKLEIIIPVQYTLTENGMKSSISPREIIEYDKLVYTVSLNTYLCSSKNTDNHNDSYLVIPSGSGALMYTDVRPSGVRSYSETVYGRDPACYQSEQILNTETVKLPFYGAKDGNNALCCIIENGAPCAEIQAFSGDGEVGYSNVYTTFHIRGTNISSVDFQGGNVKDVETICESVCGYKSLEIGYYPLENEDASYTGMAKLYRDRFCTKSATDRQSHVTLNILGGTQLDRLFLGIPHQKTVSATTLKEALDIVKSVRSETDSDMDVVLKGFGSTGLDIGEIAGGYKIARACGTKKDLKNLQKYCSENAISLYMDFDTIRFDRSSNGFSKTFDSAKTSNLFTAYQYLYSVSLRQKIDSTKYVLLNREQVGEASEKALDTAKKLGLKQIGLSSVGNICYSDYNDIKYFVRSSTESDVKKIFVAAKKRKMGVLMSNANAYAAIYADKITDAPLSSSDYDAFDTDIPLYQIVFKGMTDLSASDVNLASDQRTAMLKAIESGSGLAYTLCGTYNTEFSTTTHSEFSTALFENNRDSLKNTLKETSSAYEKIGNAKVRNHQILSENVRLTEFDNGVSVLVNYSSKLQNTDYGTVKAQSYLVLEEGKE